MNIFLIERYRLVSDLITVAFSTYNLSAQVRTFTSGDEFINSANTLREDDIIITNLLLPGISGSELIQAYRSYGRSQGVEKLKIIILSYIVDAQTIKMSIRHGATGYVSKASSIEELIAAIEKVAAGESYIAEQLRKKVIDTFIADDEIVFHLSPREKEVLQYTCDGYTVKEIAYEMGLSVHTIKTYNKSLMRKLNVHRTADLILFAIQKGLYHPH